MNALATRARVLVVDDDPSMVETLRDVLNASGFWVDAAFSGREAIERVRGNPPACILMDIRMPGLDGVATFRELKQTVPNCRVIFMTAFASSDLVSEAHQEGAVEVLPKPLDLDRAIQLIEKTTSSFSILVVGDEEASETTLGGCLDIPGLETRFVHTVDEAVLAFEQEPWQAVVVDMEYGARIGSEGLRIIRELAPESAMILLSEMGGLDAESRQSLESIATAYFSRQDSVDDVVQRVRKILAPHHVGIEGEPPRLEPTIEDPT